MSNNEERTQMATLENMVVGDGQSVTDLLSEMLKECGVEGFFGGLELKFENGRLSTCRITRLFKPRNSLSHRSRYDGQQRQR